MSDRVVMGYAWLSDFRVIDVIIKWFFVLFNHVNYGYVELCEIKLFMYEVI